MNTPESATGQMPDRAFLRGRWIAAIFLAALLVIIGWQSRKIFQVPLPKTVVLYCFSGMEEVMREGILPAFRKSWGETSGEEIEWVATYAGSGVITKNIMRRLPAEIAILSSELDGIRLAEKGLLSPGWKELPHAGVIARTPIVILAPPGNPREIADFPDIVKPGVRLVHPDPRTSGAGEWAVLAVYGFAALDGGGREQAVQLLRGIWANAGEHPSSAGEARSTFESGTWDALLTYEAERFQARLQGFDVIYPSNTVMTEAMVMKIARNIPEDHQGMVDAFVRFLWSEEAQKTFVRYGFRSVREELNAGEERFAGLKNSFTLRELGGAAGARRDILDALWYREVYSGSETPEAKVR